VVQDSRKGRFQEQRNVGKKGVPRKKQRSISARCGAALSGRERKSFCKNWGYESGGNEFPSGGGGGGLTLFWESAHAERDQKKRVSVGIHAQPVILKKKKKPFVKPLFSRTSNGPKGAVLPSCVGRKKKKNANECTGSGGLKVRKRTSGHLQSRCWKS